MKPISKETCELIDKMVALQAEIEERILEESDGIYTLCGGYTLHVQLFASASRKHDLAELESFVGPVRLNHKYDDGTNSYHFMLTDNTLGCVVMPANTTDSRTTGGEADDVCIDKEA